MRDFSKVSPNVWHSERFTSLPSDDGRLLLLYLLTCEHQNSAGAYRLPDGYASSDLRWTVDRYAKARTYLEAADLIAFDPGASVVMVKRWFRHNPPMNLSHFQGICRTLERLPSPVIAKAAYEAVQAAWDAIQGEKAATRQTAAHGPSSGSGGHARPPSKFLLPKSRDY